MIANNVTINNLLPERIDTDQQVLWPRRNPGVKASAMRKRGVDSIAAKRLGRPEEFGATGAFICSAHAGFMSGQNIHLDGGSYPALV